MGRRVSAATASALARWLCLPAGGGSTPQPHWSTATTQASAGGWAHSAGSLLSPGVGLGGRCGWACNAQRAGCRRPAHSDVTTRARPASRAPHRPPRQPAPGAVSATSNVEKQGHLGHLRERGHGLRRGPPGGVGNRPGGGATAAVEGSPGRLPKRLFNRDLSRATRPTQVAALVLAHHAQFDWIHVATALSRLGKLWVKRAVPAAELGATHDAAALLRARIVRAAAAGERVPPRVLANAVHGLAKIWLADAEFLHAISGQVAAAAPALLPAELAMLVWAYGRSRVADDAALRALAERAGALVGRLTPHSLATVAAAFADVQRAPPALFQALSCEVVRRGKAVDIVSMAKLVRGYARLGLREEPHLQMHQFVAGQLEARINEANLYDVRMLLGGWATLGFHHKGAVAALRGHVATWLEEVTSEQVAPLLWGLAQLDTAWDSEPMAQGSAGVCLGRSEHALRDGLRGLLVLHAHALPAEDLSIAALAMAILDDSAAGRAVLATHVAPFVRSYQGSFTREQYERLFQVELIHGSTEEDPVLLAQPGYGIGQRLWLEAVAEGPPEEELGLCGEVHRVLRDLGLDVEMQWRTDDGLLPVDIMLFLDAQVRPVPLQVDGRSRLSFPAPHRLLGEARAHDRMLRSRCPEVLRVPFHEWAALGCLADQRAYLLRKVQSLRQ